MRDVRDLESTLDGKIDIKRVKKGVMAKLLTERKRVKVETGGGT